MGCTAACVTAHEYRPRGSHCLCTAQLGNAKMATSPRTLTTPIQTELYFEYTRIDLLG
ncbi:hypothetical protein APTSU1_000359800 [Apodemus speciosus]|uniref:Uncharacterized protein n=1 Tax=Apodemus speciosus TaxID=105296 RepID=A0ABQ0END3_APOSI